MAIEKKHSHVPYRESKVTQLLQTSLGGSDEDLDDEEVLARQEVQIHCYMPELYKLIDLLRGNSHIEPGKLEVKRDKRGSERPRAPRELGSASS
ncbi:hypothetical protein HAZT_HAZT007052 [Hyalella azteca]|uniref:Kinesin motor domain-containing protein n=1 Tax=Hyalella azteca TaxID=294128 RepID=A0A6A0H3R8_HYAAZ|nr:hypothetical protein HAZT_HAZT007052 [Hyalella azteca]